MDDTRSIWDVMAARSAAGFADAAGEGCRAAAPRRGGCPSSYLEISGKDCDGEKGGLQPTIEEWRVAADEVFCPGQKVTVLEAPKYEIASCGCRSWFCPHCCTGRGLALRERLIPILHTFTGLLMWTFTIDPTLFSSPTAAYEYVKSKRCISNVMRRLRQRGYLHTDRYIVIVEWQKKTEMPHFHVLADASFIPFDEVCELWNRYRPADAGPVEGERPGFGSVRFSAPRFVSPKHAASYACKYLIKHPTEGYPAWVLDSSGEVHRYSTSRGFWGDSARQSRAVDDADASVDEEVSTRTIRERLDRCGERSVALRIVQDVDLATGEVFTKRQFLGILEMPIVDIAAVLRKELPESKRRMSIEPEEWGTIRHSAMRSNYGIEGRFTSNSRRIFERQETVGDRQNGDLQI
jgi:hypothetical protein